MKRFIAILITSVLCLSLMCACKSVTIPEEDYLMLAAVKMNNGDPDFMSDHWVSTTYRLTSKGYLERITLYNLSGNTVETRRLSNDKLKQIIKTLNRQKYLSEDHEYDSTEIWDIIYYDENGEEISNYNGYIENKKHLTTLIELLDSEFGSDAMLLYAKQSISETIGEGGEEISIIKEYTITHSGRMIIKTYQTDTGNYDRFIVNLSNDEIEQIKTEMETQEDEINENESNTTSWEFKYCDKNGEKLKSFVGDISTYENLTKIAEMLSTLTPNTEEENIPRSMSVGYNLSITNCELVVFHCVNSLT